MKFLWEVLLLGVTLSLVLASPIQDCLPTPTTTSGSAAISGPLCSGQLIFEDVFDTYDSTRWTPEVVMTPGEFEWYDSDPENTYTKDGRLFIKPSLTADKFGEAFLYNGTIDLGNRCTGGGGDCYRQGTPDQILPPIRSARINTLNKFSFKYGYMEVGAKMPLGDWMWPAIWLMPQFSPYGNWPTGGEIDIIESRCNEHLWSNGVDLGIERGECTLHFGPSREQDGSMKVWSWHNNNTGYNNDLHKFAFYWTENEIDFFYDDILIDTIVPKTNFWDLGNFTGDNPWINGTKMAPFDQEFYVILNVAVGGPGFFPDGAGNKPWVNGDPRSATDFWENRDQWLPTWPLNVSDGDDAAFQFDYVRVWAL